MEAQKRPRLGWPVLAALLIAAVLLYRLKLALIPFAFALIVGFITDPLIRCVQARTGWPRAAAAGVTFVGLAPRSGRRPLLRRAVDRAGPRSSSPMGRRSCATRSGGSSARAASTCSAARPAPTSSADGILASAHKAFSFGRRRAVASDVVLTLAGFFLTVVLIAYIMVSGPKLTRGAIWLIPPDRRAGVERLLPMIVPVVQRYFIGLFVIVCSTFVLAWVGWGAVLHLPHAMLLSVAVALLETVPALGPLASGVLAGAASLQAQSLTRSASPSPM